MAKVRLGLRLLETLTSALYEDPIILFREYVQNSVDSFNSAIEKDDSLIANDFFVNIKVDKIKSNIEILDNGHGIPEQEFLDKMTTIGASKKNKLINQIGFRGIGRLSAMPFCQRLIFANKPVGSNRYLVFTWNGDEFHEILNQGDDPDIDAAVGRITSSEDEDYSGDINDHFFKVIIEGYKQEISELLDNRDFKKRLCMMLPLKYCPEFTYQEQIDAEYKTFMGDSLETFSFIVKLNDDELYKPYTNNHILESDINYWKLQYPSKRKGIPGEKIGILWFTFNKVITARKKSEPYGILVRSKNMLMGDHNSLAKATFQSKNDYVATFRELTQALQGVYGEMLIHSPRLNDNARRDWFRIDDASIELRHIIFDFMKRLHEYRYAASDFFSGKEKEKEKLIKAYNALVTNPKSDTFIAEIYKLKDEEKADAEILEFANEDIPFSPVTIKRFYDQFLKILREYYLNKRELEEFIKIRTFIKDRFNSEQKR